MGILVYRIIYYAFYLIEMLIFVRCVLSFLPFYNKFTEFVYKVTEPLLSPCRKLIDKFNFNLPLDLSPIIALLILQFAQRLLLGLIVPLL